MSTLRPIGQSTLLLLVLGACSSGTAGANIAAGPAVPQVITAQRVQQVSAVMGDRLDEMLARMHPLAGN